MKKTKRAVFIGILIAIMVIFLLASENIVDLQKNNSSSYAQAYNHKYENILENVFEENGLTILPFIFENSDQTITKVYLLEQFEKAGLKVENGSELGDIIVTGDEIKTADKTYTVLIYGDVNEDGEVDTFDAYSIMKHYVFEGKYELKGIYEEAGNVDNDDNETDTFDAYRIMRFYVGLETKLVLNEPEASEKPDIPQPGDYVTGITATTEKTEYEFGEGIDTSKIIVKETLFSGKVGKTLTSSQYEISEYDPYEEGEQTVKVIYTTKNTADNTEKTFEATFKVTVKPYEPDPEAPVITLKGDKEVTVKIGQYKELGATAVDFEGNAIDEKEIVIDASQIKDKQGAYKVIYRVKDKNSGKEAIAVRTVVVIDYVTGITATTEKTEYAYGEPLDKTKIVVKEAMASKEEGTVIALEKLEITGYEPNKVGEQTITITYKTNNTIDDKEAIYTETLKLNVKNPEIKVNDGEKDITQITLYVEMPENNEMVKEDTVNGDIYTLIPISLAGYEPITVTREDIVLEKQDGKISIIDTKLDTSIAESAILVKTYRKLQDGTFEEIDENSIDQTIDYIGIAINKNVITKSEDLENIKIYYGNSKDASVTLEVNPKVDKILVDIEDNTEVTLNQPKEIQVTFKNAKDEEIDIPARRLTLNSTEMELKLLDKDKNEIDVTKKPEEPVKFISVKPEVAGENKTLKITVDKDDAKRKVEKDVKLKVTPPSIELKDEQGNNITDINLYTKKPLENDMVKEYNENGKTNIYTLIPISYKGKEGLLPLTLEDIVLAKQEGKISVIGTNVDTSITRNAILIKKYKKTGNGTFDEVTENSIDKTIDYIGIAINKDIITKPEDLKDIKIYYGNSTESSITLPVNPKVEEIIVNESNPVEITANQEIDLPVIFKINGKEVEISARRILAESTGIEVKLKDKDKVEIDVVTNPEEPVKFISVKAEEIGEDQPITITVDKNDTIREQLKQQLIQVIPPTIVAKDIQGNTIKEITLYTKKPTNNSTSEDRFEQSSDGKTLKHIITEENTDNEMVTHIYTLIPIELEGTNGPVKITSSEILGTTNKLSPKYLTILENITDKVPETSTKYSSILFKTYKKAENGSYIVLDENDSVEPVDCIGISIDDTMLDTPEELEYLKFVYGTSKKTGTTLTINPKIEEIEINDLNPVEVTVNQEISIPVAFKNARGEEVDVPARRVIAEFKGVNLHLKDKDGVEINLAERPEEPVKFIVIKASTVEKNQILTITVDKDDDIREKEQQKLVKVVSPEIEIKDEQENDITEIALYPKMEVISGTNEDRFEQTSDGKTVKHIITEENNDSEMVTHVYTLIPIKLKGINGDIDITSAEIISNTNKLSANYLTILEDRTDKAPETSTKYSSILFKAYKKVGDNYQALDENDSIDAVEYIGISIDDTMVDSPEDLEYIKFVYGTDKEAGKKLTIVKKAQDNP